MRTRFGAAGVSCAIRTTHKLYGCLIPVDDQLRLNLILIHQLRSHFQVGLLFNLKISRNFSHFSRCDSGDNLVPIVESDSPRICVTVLTAVFYQCVEQIGHSQMDDQDTSEYHIVDGKTACASTLKIQ